MKIVLLRDIKRFGQKGEVHEVSDGYASSYLIPQGLARHASISDQDQIQAKQEKNKAQHQKKAQHDADLFGGINKTKIVLMRGTNRSGKLFESIKPADICTQLQGLKPEHIKLKRPIKEVGEYTLDISIGEHTGTIIVSVQAQ